MATTKKALAVWQKSMDSMSNLVSGLGVSGVDKSVSTRYGFVTISDDQLIKAYRGDWIARKIIDIPAHDATREWRLWEAEDDQIQELEKAERELNVKAKVRDALIKARLFGGSVIIMGVRKDDPSKELDPETVKQGDLKFLHVAARNEVTAGELEYDPMSEHFGMPKYYQFSAASASVAASTANLTIHPSRIVRFIGNPRPQIVMGDGWGDSVLQANDDAIKQAGTVNAALAIMINECKTDVLQIPDLMQNLATDEYERQLMARLQLASTAKSIVNTLILDKEEVWQRIQTNFAGLGELLSTFLTIASGAADIPATRMLGQSAKGLNATGESDMRNYYDMVAAQQENVMRPAMKIMDEVLIRHALGDFPEEVAYEWAPLWQLDEETKAKVAFNKAQAFAIHHDSGLIDPTALSDALINQLVEDNIYPGLQQSLLDAAKTTEGFDPAMASPNPSVEKPLTPQEEAANELAKTKIEAGPAIGGPAGNTAPGGRDVKKQKGAKNAKSAGQRTAPNTDATWNDHVRRLKRGFSEGTVPTQTGDYNPNHAPAGNEHGGEFAEAPGGSGADLSKAMTRSLENSGGFTFNTHGVTPKTGFAVGGYDGKPQYDVSTFSANDAQNFLSQNQGLLHSGQGFHVGGWVDGGKVYLDVVKVFGSRRGAVKAGRRNNQIAVADLARIHAKDFDHAFIPTGGTGDAMPDDDDQGSDEIKGAFHLFPADVTAEELFAALKEPTADYNPNHEPAGSEKGGEFTTAEGGGAPKFKSEHPVKLDPKEVQALFSRASEKYGISVGLKAYAEEMAQSIYDDYDFEGYGRGVRDALEPFLEWLTGETAMTTLAGIAGATKVDALKALVEVAEGEIRATLTKMLEHATNTATDAAMDKHARASRDRLLHAANWLREAATGDWLKDIED